MSVVMPAVRLRHDAHAAQDGAFFDEGFSACASDWDDRMQTIHGQSPDSTTRHPLLALWRGVSSFRHWGSARLTFRLTETGDYFKKKWGFAVGDKEYVDNYIIALG